MTHTSQAADREIRAVIPVRPPCRTLGLAIVSVVASCASPPPLPPATSIASVNDIAGTWHGMGARYGRAYPLTSIVRRDGTWSSDNNGFRSHGTYQLANGEATWRSLTTGATGTWVLRKVDGKIELFGQASNGVTFVDTRAH